MSSRRAFTLIELMVVILIVAVVIAIVIPAVGGARDAAKKADTQGLLNRIGQAAASFETSERRPPGYFSPQEMGAASNNNTRGMSAMENLMLDLIGFVQPPAGAVGTNIVSVGPVPTNPQFVINLDTFGVPSEATKAYFTPDPKHYIAMPGPNQQVGAMGHAAADGAPQLKDVVDAWGNPVLAWQRDDRAVQPVNQESDFVTTTSQATPARYYWQSNACFLESQSLGRKGYNQAHTERGSFLNQAAGGGAAGVTTSLMGLLGSPSHYKTNTAGTPMYLPTAGRAALLLHSPGSDGIFLSKKDRGARQFAAGLMDYGVNVAPDPTSPVGPTNQYTDANGKPTNNDLLKLFDDVTATAGN